MRLFLMLLVLTLCSPILGCGDTCENGESRCANGIAQNCMLGDDQEPYWAETSCDESATYCLIPEELDYALCSVLEGPMPGCPDTGVETVCLSTNMVVCQDGYAISTKECMICEATSFSQKCSGRIGDYCMHKGECLPGLECMDVPDQVDDICTLPCDCSDGPCDVCTQAESFAKVGIPSCRDGMCQ